RRVGRILPGEDRVVGGERLAVVPLDSLLQLDGDRQPIAGDAAVVHARQLGGQDRDGVAVGVEGHERLVEDARAVAVLHADGEVWIQDRRRLPPQGLQLATAAAAGGREGGPLRLSVRDPMRSQQRRDQRRRKPEAEQRPYEVTAAERASPDTLKPLANG